MLNIFPATREETSLLFVEGIAEAVKHVLHLLLLRVHGMGC